MRVQHQEHSVKDALDALEWRLLAQARKGHGVQGRDWWVSVIAALSAVALHSMLLAPLAFGVSVRAKRMPDDQGSGSNAILASAEMVPTLTFISLSPTVSGPENALLELASRGIAPPQISLIIASPDADLAFEHDSSESEDQEMAIEDFSASGAHRAMLFGRYMGQVAARVERAWVRPRAAVDSGHFECQTRIEQDESGRVLSIELLSCNGDLRWQQSLVSAIDRASPLSAPPEPSVFTSTLFLNFEASQYEQGVSVDSEYEGAIGVASANIDPESALTISHPARGIEEVRTNTGAIKLTIVGKNASWMLQEAEKSGGEALQTH